MGSSVVPDSGRSRFDNSNDVGLNDIGQNAAMARLRDYFGGGDEFADILNRYCSA